MKLLIKQALLLPLLFFVPITAAGLLVDDYNWIGQHASEITLTDFSIAKTILNSGAILTGLSCVAFSLGIVISFKNHFISALLLMAFGVSMISNGLYTMGNPMHGFYGMGLSLMLLPFASCYEFKNTSINPQFFSVTIFSCFVIFIYFWSMLVGLDPIDYRGLTQRLASVFIFGWIAYFAFEVHKLGTGGT